jgi:hypothetical protein
VQSDQDEAMRLSTFESDVTRIEGNVAEVVREVLAAKPEHRLLIHQAEWHVRGLIYHLRRMVTVYHAVAADVGGLKASNPDVIIVHSVAMQELIFEFYALTALARILLDQLKNYVAPTFVTSAAELPNSVTRMLGGETNCPLYEALGTDHLSILRYLIDLRDCLVHHRSFATSDNTVAVRAGTDTSHLDAMELPWYRAITQVEYRDVGEDGIAVNVLLPDAIFEYNAAGERAQMIRPFTHEAGNNLLSQSREFTNLCAHSAAEALVLLASTAEPIYVWTRPRS